MENGENACIPARIMEKMGKTKKGTLRWMQYDADNLACGWTFTGGAKVADGSLIPSIGPLSTGFMQLQYNSMVSLVLTVDFSTHLYVVLISFTMGYYLNFTFVLDRSPIQQSF